MSKCYLLWEDPSFWASADMPPQPEASVWSQAADIALRRALPILFSPRQTAEAQGPVTLDVDRFML